MIEAAIKGTTVGTAVGVAVLLGATPGGFIVFAVGTGTYFIVEQGIALWREHQAKKIYKYRRFISLWYIVRFNARFTC